MILSSSHKKSLIFKLSLCSGMSLFCGLAFATAGSMDYGYGAISKSMGGTGVALPEDSFAPAVNPAGIAFLDQQADVGVAIFSPRRGYEADSGYSPFGVAPGTHWSNTDYFVIPQLGYTQPFANQRGAFGVSLYGNGGMDTNYGNNLIGSSLGPGSGVFGTGSAGINFKQMFLNMALAWKFTPEFSVGASLIPTVQSLSAKGVSAFSPFSAYPNDVSNNGTDYSYGVGARFGALFRPSSIFSAGISYQPQISMSAFDDYKGLLPDKGTLDTPANGTAGISISPHKNISINADIQRIWFENVDAYGNSTSICSLSSGEPCLGINNGAGFNWKNSNVYKLGAQWIATENWTWRAGYAHATQPVPSTTVDDVVNIIAPAVTQDHYTVGFSYAFNSRFSLNPYFMYAPKVSSTGENQFNSQPITLFMRQYELGTSLTWKIGA